jgi:hypothetical protein
MSWDMGTYGIEEQAFLGFSLWKRRELRDDSPAQEGRGEG